MDYAFAADMALVRSTGGVTVQGAGTSWPTGTGRSQGDGGLAFVVVGEDLAGVASSRRTAAAFSSSRVQS